MARNVANQARLFGDWRIALKSALVFWALYALTIFARAFLTNDIETMIVNRGQTIAIGFALTLGIYLLVSIVARNGSWRKRVVVSVIGAVIAALAQSAILMATDKYREKPQEEFRTESVEGYKIIERGRSIEIIRPEKESVTVTFQGVEKLDRSIQLRIFADNAVIWLFFFGAWVAFYLAMTAQRRAHDLRHRAAAAEAAAQSAQVRALRYQVNPHFLFNTLNSLSSLVMTERNEQAEKMLLALSTFFRTSLSLDPNADVTLAEEIDLQRLYLDIEKVRFPSRLKVEISIPPDLEDARVPALILQPLVENAVKYGVSRTKENVTLRITAAKLSERRMSITVSNTGEPGVEPRKPSHDDPGINHGTGVGLANVCQRLDARFGGQATCDFGPKAEGGYEVHLTFPLTRKDG